MKKTHRQVCFRNNTKESRKTVKFTVRIMNCSNRDIARWDRKLPESRLILLAGLQLCRRRVILVSQNVAQRDCTKQNALMPRTIRARIKIPYQSVTRGLERAAKTHATKLHSEHELICEKYFTFTIFMN